MTQEISDWIVEWFRSRGKGIDGEQKGLAIDYLQSGLLTSLEIVELVAAIEDHFGVQFSDADMQDARFSTIGGLGELVAAVLTRDRREVSQSEAHQCGPRSLKLESSNERSRVG